MLRRFEKMFGVFLSLAVAASLFLVIHLAGRGFGLSGFSAAACGLLAGCAWLFHQWRSGIAGGAIHRNVANAEPANEDCPAPNGETESRMRLDWKTGIDFLNVSRERRSLPWYISLGHESEERKQLLAEVAIPGAMPHRTLASGFTWHFAKKAVFLDVDFATLPDDGGRWRLFAAKMAEHARQTRLGGVIVNLDARRLARSRDVVIRTEASLLRSRLDELIRATGVRVPVYIAVNRIDGLYGMRSLMSRIPPERLSQPLGAFARVGNEPPGVCAARILMEARRYLATLAAVNRDAPDFPANRQPHTNLAASMQAPEELSRLETPLEVFCAEAFTANPYQHAASLRGVFLGATSFAGDVIPPQAAEITALPEGNTPDHPWFLPPFLGEWLPRDITPGRALGGPLTTVLRKHAGLAALFFGTLALCWHMTWTFRDTRQAMKDVVGLTDRPTAAAELEPYFGMIAKLEKTDCGRLRLVGGRQYDALARELRRRYCESYRELVLLPYFDETRRAAAAASLSRDPAAIGDTMLAISRMRRHLAIPPAAEALPIPALDSGAPQSRDRQFSAYLAWSSDEHEQALLLDSLQALEKRLFANAFDGDVMRWLPIWAEGKIAEAGIAGASWNPDADGAGGADRAWTKDGYEAAKALFADLDGNPTSDTLGLYRTKALEYWRERVEGLWRNRLAHIDDANLHRHIAASARGHDPATAMLKELQTHLLPMFPEADGNPEIEWLRQYSRLLPEADRANGVPDALAGKFAHRMFAGFETIAAKCTTAEANLQLVRLQYRKSTRTTMIADAKQDDIQKVDKTRDPFVEAGEAAASLDVRLKSLSGGEGWQNLSPLASYHYLRYLATRLAAVNLDDHWRGTVYNRALLIKGSETAKLVGHGGLLEKFLEEFSGFWVHDAGVVRNAEWAQLPFMFNRDFLDFCNQAVRQSRLSQIEMLELPFNIHSLGVDAEARERPVRMEIDWRGLPYAENEEKIVFRNFAVENKLRWKAGLSGDVSIRIVLPSITLTKTFDGDLPLGAFVKAFANGELILTREDFPDQSGALTRLGINRFVIRADFGRPETAEAFLARYMAAPLRLPHSIIIGGSPEPDSHGAATPDMNIHAAGELEARGLFGTSPVSYTLPNQKP